MRENFHIEIDGLDVTGPMTLTGGNGWQSWIDVTSAPVPLTVGSHEFRIVMDTGGFNVNYVDASVVSMIPSGAAASSKTESEGISQETSGGGSCGMLGMDALLLLGMLAVVRRKRGRYFPGR